MTVDYTKPMALQSTLLPSLAFFRMNMVSLNLVFCRLVIVRADVDLSALIARVT
jgi:hypothetical protein